MGRVNCLAQRKMLLKDQTLLFLPVVVITHLLSRLDHELAEGDECVLCIADSPGCSTGLGICWFQ